VLPALVCVQAGDQGVDVFPRVIRGHEQAEAIFALSDGRMGGGGCITPRSGKWLEIITRSALACSRTRRSGSANITSNAAIKTAVWVGVGGQTYMLATSRSWVMVSKIYDHCVDCRYRGFQLFLGMFASDEEP
jgi:hypothetical protein